MTNEGKGQAAMAVWPWRENAAEKRANARRALQRHGALRAVVALCVGGGLMAFGHHTLAAVVGIVASTTLLLAVLSPAHAYAALQRALERFGRVVGTTLTFAILTPLYLLVITPFGLLFRRGKRDPLHRAWSQQQASYWTPRADSVDTAERRKRPF